MSVWYIGTADERIITIEEWAAAGITSDSSDHWNKFNGWSVPESEFNPTQTTLLESLTDQFWVGAPEGPRPPGMVVSDDSKFAILDDEGIIIPNQLPDYLQPEAIGAVTHSILSYGASTDAPDNRTFIQEALDEAAPGDEVFVPSGVFNVGVDAITGMGMIVRTGVTLRIDGTMRIKNNATGWKSLFVMETDSTVRGGGKIDCNPAGNPLTGPPVPGTRRVAQNANSATGELSFRDLKVIGHVGHNAIYFSSSAELSDASVVGTHFIDTGIGTTAETAHDHSTLYLEAHRVYAVRNTFTGGSPYGAHAAVETHGASQIVSQNISEDYVIFGNLTGVQVNDGDNIVWTQNIGRRCMIGVALYASSVNGGSDPALRSVTIGFNQFSIDRDYFLPFNPEMGAPVAYGVGLYSEQADLAIENLTIAYNHIVFEPYSMIVATDEFNSSGIDLWRVTANANPDKNIRIENNTIVNPPAAGIRVATSNTEQLIIRNNEIVNPGGSVSSTMANAFRTGIIVTGGAHRNPVVQGNMIFDNRVVHKIASVIDLSAVASVIGFGRIVDNEISVADGVNVAEVLTPSGVGKRFYVEATQAGPWQGFWTPCAPGSKIRVKSTGDTYVNATVADGDAPAWVRQQAGRLIIKPSDITAATGALGTRTKKIAVWDENGLSVLGYIAVYDSIA